MEPVSAKPGTQPKEKRCPHCGETLPLTPEYWHRDRTRSSGLYPYCKQCHNAMSIARKHLIRGPVKSSRWTPAEDRIMREKYPTTSTCQLAGLLHRSPGATKTRAGCLGVRKRRRVVVICGDPYAQCTHCGKWKLSTREYFYPTKWSKTGFQSWCKECERELGRRMRRGLWAAQWRAAATQLLTGKEAHDEEERGTD